MSIVRQVIDAVPVNGSTNPVSSDGVFDQLATKQAAGSYAPATHTHSPSDITYSHYIIPYSASPSLNWNNGISQEITLTGAATFSYANIPDGAMVALKINQDSTGGRNITWPAASRIEGTLTTTANAINSVVVWRTGSVYLLKIGLHV